MKRANTAVKLADLNRAMDRRRPVTISALKELRDGWGPVRDFMGQPRLVETTRTIEIFGFRTTEAGHIVVQAMDREQGKPRDFRVDRILTYTVHRASYLLETPEPAESETVTPGVRFIATATSIDELVDWEINRTGRVRLAA